MTNIIQLSYDLQTIVIDEETFSSRFSSNSEANASELLEELEEMVLQFFEECFLGTTWTEILVLIEPISS